jgi:aryl sulfotransferase
MMMPTSRPEVIHTYQNHLLDSTRWRHYQPRDDDIVIATAYKSGTTWMQAILVHLVLGTESIPSLGAVSPWLERRGDPIDEVVERLEAQQHRRFIKTHLALDGLPFHPQVRYIVVGRDARDVFMSMWNHYGSFTETFYTALNNFPGRVGPPLPLPPQDIHAFWWDWISRGWFEWESEGYPFWGNLHHTKTWWQYRNLENILFVHFNDLLADLTGEIRRIASFLNIECSDQTISEVAQAVTFPEMQKNADKLLPGAENVWRGGPKTFIFKGTNGRWKDVLSAEELALYEEKVAEVLTADCGTWLEQGRAAPSFQPLSG